ncbi:MULTISPECIES: hypothetical protein [Isoptericola]|uniref:hypothetical protein n=1 Tax=Isoptericola TaxID=254250 RepID=UPI000D062BB6|nr:MULTISPECIES: hypothetical protein [Isoptericola]
MEYRRRVVDDELRIALQTSGAVLIEGPKACGKTATAQEAATAVRHDTDRPAREAASVAPDAVITATGYGYRRDDGVPVIPVGALGP